MKTQTAKAFAGFVHLVTSASGAYNKGGAEDVL